MSLLDSLFVSVFGIVVVFAVLIGLYLLLRFQSALITKFTRKKLSEVLVQEPSIVVQAAALAPSNESLNLVNSDAQPQQKSGQSRGNLLSSAVGEPIKKYTAIVNNKVYTVEVESVTASSVQ